MICLLKAHQYDRKSYVNISVHHEKQKKKFGLVDTNPFINRAVNCH